MGTSVSLCLEDRPELINDYYAAEFSMSMFKPIYAGLSDLFPIMGRRRVPYMAAGGGACRVSLPSS